MLFICWIAIIWGGYRRTDNRQIVQTLHECGTGSFGAPAYWNGHVYYLCREDVLKDFALVNGNLSLKNKADPDSVFAGTGATPTISANGTKDGIVWVLECRNPGESLAALYAYDATDVSKELYSSRQVKEDHAGTGIRFAIPTVADGRVFVGTKGEVDVYGLLGTARSGMRPTLKHQQSR